MQLRHSKNVTPALDSISRVAAIAWSPNGLRLAVCDHNRTVHLFDDQGVKRDKFATKSADQTAKSKTYSVRGLAFSPDSTMLAVAQSDKMVFVYNIGENWGDKKGMKAKFPEKSPVNALVWPNKRLHELCFGLNDGKVRIGNVGTNDHPQTMYDGLAPVAAMAARHDGTAIISSHVDGTIWKFVFDDTGTSNTIAYQKIWQHPQPNIVLYALTWGETIVAAGADMKVHFLDESGQFIQQPQDYYVEGDRRAITTASSNPSGYCVTVGSYDKMRVFNFNQRQRRWEEGNAVSFENLGAITAQTWSHDGTKLTVGGMRGTVDNFDACIKEYRYKQKFQFTYVAHNCVIVTLLQSRTHGNRVMLQSVHGTEISRVSVFHDRYLISHTPNTLLLGDLITCELSEVPWNSQGSEKFVFDSEQVCLVYNAGELSVVEYGNNEILGSVRTDNINPALLSVRIFQPRPSAIDQSVKKVIAHLIDRQTVRVYDLVTGITVSTVHHSQKLDWLELNHRCTKLLFRDKNRQLFVFDLPSQTKNTLLNFCSYVQWVPDSDVVVAQNRTELCVWYSIDSPDRVTTVPVHGECEDIVRAPNDKGVMETTVHFKGGSPVALPEALIGFGTAMEDRNFVAAAELLDGVPVTAETEAMWSACAVSSLQAGQYAIAERCYAALGDVAKAKALQEINELASAKASEMKLRQGNDAYDGYSNPEVQARIACLSKNFKQAEAVLCEHGRVEDALKMWQDMRKYDMAVNLALARRLPQADDMKDEYLAYLKEQHMEELAGQMYERDGKYKDAVEMYLLGGLPASAARVVMQYNPKDVPQELQAQIASVLRDAGLYERAGVFFERLGQSADAIQAYVNGNSYRAAVDLARKAMPAYVVELEEKWGDWLSSDDVRQPEQAINHYIEANKDDKAIMCAMQARHWAHAVRIVDGRDPNDETTKRYYNQIAKHYELQRLYPEAEKYFVKAGNIADVVAMYQRINRWESAFKIAKQFWTDEQVAELYGRQARNFVAAGKYADAERVYLQGGIVEPKLIDQCCSMYMKARRYDDCIRVTRVHRPNLLPQVRQKAAVQLVATHQYKQAEKLFVEDKNYQLAVKTYKQANLWEDALRVAKKHGGMSAAKLVIFEWASTLKGEQGARLLTKYSLVEQAIEWAVEKAAADPPFFEVALELAHSSMPAKLPYVYLKKAMSLEDNGNFKEAEENFIKANKPREAVDMHIDMMNWQQAMDVAERYDPSYVPEVYVAQARIAFERHDYQNAEAMMLKAHKPEQLCKIYSDSRMWEDAKRVAREHCPDEYKRVVEQAFRAEENPVKRGDMARDSEQWNEAIEAYLAVDKEHIMENEGLIAAWTQAVDIAFSHVKNKIQDTMARAADKLCGVGAAKLAADLYIKQAMYKEAVDVYKRPDVNMWDDALKLAEQALENVVVEKLHEEHQLWLKSRGDAAALIETGEVEQGLSLYMEQNQWEEMITAARKQPDKEIMLKFSAQYVGYLVGEDRYKDSVNAATQDGFHVSIVYYPLYRSMFRGANAHELAKGLSNIRQGENGLWYLPNGVSVSDLWARVRVLYDAVAAMGPSEELTEMAAVSKVVYYHSIAESAVEFGFNDLKARLMMAVCRYLGTMSADKAFYDAGVACRVNEWEGPAFVFLSRFLDVIENAEDEDMTSGDLENADFELSDVPTNFPMPSKLAIAKEDEETVRKWVLTEAVNSAMEPSLNFIKCTKCEEDIADFCAVCPRDGCGQTYETCIISGGPILDPEAAVSCRVCNSKANRDDWNRFIIKSKVCPYCQNPQAPVF